ncbi:hypothetical protein KUTeg_015351 [Tegillarca granosa]|uniref:EGF-like domain-containing protein n=1 Tax=Tegillarca granosa TaxID=220873 RepID=A0ABQ9EPV4_TEGGR|nr:hypothetical protein KUTeg_015351 [Tegillarca granosa]
MKSQMDVLLADDTKLQVSQQEITKLWHTLQMETSKIAENQKRLTSLESKVVSSTSPAKETKASCTACTAAKHPCASDPCKNGGQCLEVNHGYMCICDLNYSGKNCEQTNHCFGVNCQNGGTCVSNMVGSSCVCATGFTGPNCESKLDACSSNPCVNGLCFLDNKTDFTCLCKDGFTGSTCAVASQGAHQTLVPLKSTIPTTSRSPRFCANGNTCNDPAICIDKGPSNYTCECPPTNKTMNDICFEPFYYKDFDWCCVKNVCINNSQPICD